MFMSRFPIVAVSIIFSALFFFGPFALNAQKLKPRKNTIRINITNPAIFTGNSFIVGYERVLKNNRSIVIGVGTAGLPNFASGLSTDSVQVTRSRNGTGFHISGEYRFYLSKENKYAAPRGVYLAPFYSYNQMNRGNDWKLQTASLQGNASTDLNLNIHTVGVALGYQFVFWNRLAVDLVMIGPGVGFYNVKTKVNSNLPPEQRELLYNKLNELLERRFPGYDFVIDDGAFANSGSSSTTSLGFRYNIHIGFRF
jgi:hypothetical protein